MTTLTVVGGLYREHCVWPAWDRAFGSGGRAAAAIAGHVDDIAFHTYASDDVAAEFRPQAELDGVEFNPLRVTETVSFAYEHCLSTPKITPHPSRIVKREPIVVSADVVLRFGMLEGTAQVDATCCIYDPQSAFAPESFSATNSRADRLAIVGNRDEIRRLGRAADHIQAAEELLEHGAEVVVVKSGPAGASVVTTHGETHVPPHRTENVWTLGSGDVFAAIFAARWGAHGADPVDAAQLASLAVAAYSETMALPIPGAEILATRSAPVATRPSRVYLAGPFFTLGQRWLINEVRQALIDFGLDVFSPLHDVGEGPASVVGPADIKALNECEVVFAVLDGLDSGTLFEVGYARAQGIPVYSLAQTVSTEDLKMIEGTDCKVYADLVTALHHLAWRT